MGTKSTLGEDSDLPDHALRGELVVTVDDNHKRHHTNTQIAAASDDQYHSLKYTPVTAGGVFAHRQLSWDTRGSFGLDHERPAIFFDSANVSAEPVRFYLEEDNVNHEKETNDFHDSDAEDVYDLFLAVNGALDGDLLDIRKLNELTTEEAKILNVPRLKEIWDHTATGCRKCKDIIRTLHIVRNVLREDAKDVTTTQHLQLDQVDSNLH